MSSNSQSLTGVAKTRLEGWRVRSKTSEGKRVKGKGQTKR